MESPADAITRAQHLIRMTLEESEPCHTNDISLNHERFNHPDQYSSQLRGLNWRWRAQSIVFSAFQSLVDYELIDTTGLYDLIAVCQHLDSDVVALKGGLGVFRNLSEPPMWISTF